MDGQTDIFPVSVPRQRFVLMRDNN